MEVTIEGVPIIFPFQPYGIQYNYMRCVIKALQNKQNALLESPTGTGKTLSLLCAALAWLDTKKYENLALPPANMGDDSVPFKIEDDFSFVEGKSDKSKDKRNKKSTWKTGLVPIKIIYASRTHSQLNQACKELKRSHYSYCSSVTIGSREQMCINPGVTALESISARNQACRQKVKSRECEFHKDFDQRFQDLNLDGNFVYDIEDMVQFGKKNKCCPYYTAKAKSDQNTSLIFMPYNYVIDPKIRQTLKMEFTNSVIIFDEGHNIEQVCEDSMSAELKAEWLALAVTAFDNTLNTKKQIEDGNYTGQDEKNFEEIDIHELARVKMYVCDLERECDTLVRSVPNGKGHHNPEALFNIFSIIGIDLKTAGKINSISEKLITHYVTGSSSNYMLNTYVSALTSLNTFLEMLVPFGQENVNVKEHINSLNKNYKVYTELEPFESNSNQRAGWRKKAEKKWTINLWCLSPSVAIKSLLGLGVHNILITSGTLSPLDSFESEMGVPFPIKLQNCHVIQRTQLSLQMVFKDPNGMDLAASFERRNDNKYYQGLGLALIELARVIPKGVFVFFSSYTAINKSMEVWKNGSTYNIWNSISNMKQIFIEPKNKSEFTTVIEDFRNACDTTRNGAMFMAVSRGKLSEGIDLRDDYCRAVIIIGLPYPARYDPRVELKQNYLNDRKKEAPGALTGMQWYMLQMKRALNQAVGRVVRHRNDFGTIIIFDSRFQKLNDGLSRWIQPFVARDSFKKTFNNNISDIQSFFNSTRNVGQPTPSKEVSSVDLKDSSILSSSKPQMTPAAQVKLSSAQKAINEEYSKAFDDLRSASVGPDAWKSSSQDAKQLSQSTSQSNKTSSSGSIFNAFDSPTSSKNIKRKMEPNSEQQTRFTESAKKPRLLFEKKASYFSHENIPEADTAEVVLEAITDSNDGTEKDFKELFKKETQDMQTSIRSVFKSPRLFETFNDILELLNDQQSPRRYRQFMETIKVYSKTPNVQYIALRMNFILDFVDKEQRNPIMKRFSEVVRAIERKIFLKIGHVDD